MELVEPSTMREADLLRAVVAGDPASVRTLMDEHLPVVYGFVLARVGGNESTAEDIMQETLIESVRSAESFRGDSTLSTWLCTIARRRIARHWERERKYAEVSTAMLAHAEEPHVVVDVRDEVVRALGNLAPLHRQVLVMKYLDEYSVEQIAHEVGRPRVQVQSLLQRARDALRRQLEPNYG
ncbi:MAG: sigma-70 family RNA polymerase sigma factor [Actinomycetota bacterium]